MLESTPLENIPSAPFDLSTLGLDDPRVRTHYAVDGVTALILNLLMIVAGVGLLSLRERAEELGGQCEVLCPASGGTTVRAVLPHGLRTADETTLEGAGL